MKRLLKKNNRTQAYTLVELLIYVPLLGLLILGAIRLIDTTTTTQKKAVVSVAIEKSQNLALQNYLKRPVIKKSLNQALALKPAGSHMSDLENCFAGVGSLCQTNFGSIEIPLLLENTDPLLSDISGSFDQNQKKCADPATCNKLFEQRVIATILCPSEDSCTQFKLKIAANFQSSPGLIGANAPIGKQIEVDIPTFEFLNSGIKGVCATNEGYVNSINVGSNTLSCASANDTLPAVVLSNSCATPSFDGTRILAGLENSEISNNNNCQTVPIADWSQSASGYPTAANAIPNAVKIFALNPPRVSNTGLEGDIVLILDDSLSMKKARAEVATGIRKIVESLASKQGSLHITGYTTDTYQPISYSMPPSNINPDAGVKLILSSEETSSQRTSNARIELNDPFMDFDLATNNSGAAETVESKILNFPYSQSEELESPACTLMRIILQDSQKNFASTPRKKAFVMFSDENDAYELYGRFNNPTYTWYNECLHNESNVSKKGYDIYKRIDIVLANFMADDENSLKTVRPPKAHTKVFQGYKFSADVTLQYKYWNSDLDPTIRTTNMYVNINPTTYGLNPVASQGKQCPSQLINDLKAMKEVIDYDKILKSNRYYTVKATDAEKNAGPDISSCTLGPNYSNPIGSVIKRSEIGNDEAFYSANPLKDDPNFVLPWSYIYYIGLSDTPSPVGYSMTVPTNLVAPDYYLPSDTWSTISGSHKSVPAALSDALGFPSFDNPQGYNRGKALDGLISDALQKVYGNMFSFSSIVFKNAESIASCTGNPASKNTLFQKIAALLPQGSSSVTDFCDFNNYENTFNDIKNYLSTSDVDYDYEVQMDDTTKLSLKNFLSTHTPDELIIQVTLMLAADSTLPADLIILERDIDFTLEVIDLNTDNPKLMIHFKNNPTMNDRLNKFKHVKVILG